MRKYTTNRRVVAEDELVTVAPEASDLLFEVEDVADLVSEVTGEEVMVEADEDSAVFTVGEDTFTVEADGTEEIVESSKSIRRGKTTVKANRRRPGSVAKHPIGASRRQPARKANRTVRRIGR